MSLHSLSPLGPAGAKAGEAGLCAFGAGAGRGRRAADGAAHDMERNANGVRCES